MQVHWLAISLALAFCVGCGTTKWSDTARTATEQLLISDAMDRAVSQLDLRALAGKTVFIDESPLKGTVDASPQRGVVDSTYLVSTIRQHLLASGCILKEKKDDAEYVLEIRAGAVGTDRHDVLFGVPATNIPTVAAVPGVPTSIPEIPLMKKTEQQALTKLAVFAYNRKTGRPVWQSGVVHAESKAKDFWVFGAGPFQRGSIYEGTEFAPTGGKLDIPLVDLNKKKHDAQEAVSVADEAYFVEPAEGSEPQVAQQPTNQVSQNEPAKSSQEGKKSAEPAAAAEKPAVVPAGHTSPAPEAAKPGMSPAAAPQGSASPMPSAAPIQPSSGQAIQVPLINTPPVTSPPPEVMGPSAPIPGPSSSVPNSAVRPGQSGMVVPLPPVAADPDEPSGPTVLEKLLRFRQ
ncbi:MAG: hypothetical protein HUU20_01665 [Pirellulales bacterium]|nr:hypothetical protein [Pirellulales bacterium]